VVVVPLVEEKDMSAGAKVKDKEEGKFKEKFSFLNGN